MLHEILFFLLFLKTRFFCVSGLTSSSARLLGLIPITIKQLLLTFRIAAGRIIYGYLHVDLLHLDSLDKRHFGLDQSLFTSWLPLLGYIDNGFTSVILIVILLYWFWLYLIDRRRFRCDLVGITTIPFWNLNRFLRLDIAVGHLWILNGNLIFVIVHILFYYWWSVLRLMLKRKVLLDVFFLNISRLYNILDVYRLHGRNRYFLLLLRAIDRMEILICFKSAHFFRNCTMISCRMSSLVSFVHITLRDSSVGNIHLHKVTVVPWVFVSAAPLTTS